MAWTALLWLAVGSQDVAELIEDLGSDAIAVREDAAARLVEIGRKVIPSLEEAAKDSDLEVAGRAKVLVRRILIREKLTPALLKAIPTIDLRLMVGGDPAWTVVFWEATDQAVAGKLEGKDLGCLIGPAIRGARLGTEKRRLCGIAGIMKLRSAVPDLLGLLKDTNGDVRTEACRALGRIGETGCVSALVPLLGDRYLYARGEAAEALGLLGAVEAAPHLVGRLGDKQPYVQKRAAEALELLGPPALPAVEKGLEHPDDAVRKTADAVRRAIRSRHKR